MIGATGIAAAASHWSMVVIATLAGIVAVALFGVGIVVVARCGGDVEPQVPPARAGRPVPLPPVDRVDQLALVGGLLACVLAVVLGLASLQLLATEAPAIAAVGGGAVIIAATLWLRRQPELSVAGTRDRARRRR